ncbi:unnamed protein product [Rhizoctonia solani]|uniref:Uncharacterized protein n=1 Tax=Rhizoctonia solani TaxID=456999 RepID=A0A8H3AV31_9AGAM|nr:unnamed protein product [Rhizoctonia solani]
MRQVPLASPILADRFICPRRKSRIFASISQNFGLPLSVTLALVLAFTPKHMTKERLVVCVPLGKHGQHQHRLYQQDRCSHPNPHVSCLSLLTLLVFTANSSSGSSSGCRRMRVAKTLTDFPLEMAELDEILHSLFNEALAINSTVFEDKNPGTGGLEFDRGRSSPVCKGSQVGSLPTGSREHRYCLDDSLSVQAQGYGRRLSHSY